MRKILLALSLSLFPLLSLFLSPLSASATSFSLPNGNCRVRPYNGGFTAWSSCRDFTIDEGVYDRLSLGFPSYTVNKGDEIVVQVSLSSGSLLVLGGWQDIYGNTNQVLTDIKTYNQDSSSSSSFLTMEFHYTFTGNSSTSTILTVPFYVYSNKEQNIQINGHIKHNNSPLSLDGVTSRQEETNSKIDDVNDNVTSFYEAYNDQLSKESNAEDSVSALDSSSLDTSNEKTQSLLDFLGQVISTIKSASASNNCVLFLNSSLFSLGEVDFCSLSVPAAFSVISSIFLISFFIPFALSVIRSIFSTIKELLDD